MVRRTCVRAQLIRTDRAFVGAGVVEAFLETAGSGASLEIAASVVFQGIVAFVVFRGTVAFVAFRETGASGRERMGADLVAMFLVADRVGSSI